MKRVEEPSRDPAAPQRGTGLHQGAMGPQRDGP